MFTTIFTDRKWPTVCDFTREFKCANDVCISLDKVCDLKDDCGDFSDERGCQVGECNPVHRGGCQHKCTPVGDKGYVCVCPKGYKVSSNNTKKCENINECATFGHNCSQICTNLEGYYNCSCRPGFRMVNEKCIATGHPPVLFIANGLDVRAIDNNQQYQSSLIVGESRVQAIDYDPIKGIFLNFLHSFCNN